ncbi:MAG: class I SAM-dependent methyltransferase [Candidatus Binatia bacterium]
MDGATPAGETGLSDNAKKHTSHNPLQRFLIARFHARLLQLLRDVEFSTLLDAGCGEGFTLSKLADRYPAVQLTGTDRNPAALRHGGGFPSRVPRVCGDVTRLPYAERAFDVVLVAEVLEHLHAPDECLSEIARVTRRYVVATVPNEPYFCIANLLRGKNVAAWGNDPGHVQHWSTTRFAAVVRRHFRVLRCTTAFPWTLVLAERP